MAHIIWPRLVVGRTTRLLSTVIRVVTEHCIMSTHEVALVWDMSQMISVKAEEEETVLSLLGTCPVLRHCRIGLGHLANDFCKS